MEHADLELCVDYDAPIALGDFRDPRSGPNFGCAPPPWWIR
jgi:hypothetical protein